MSVKISPSVASCNQLRIEEELSRIGDNFETLHVDIEDGNFVDNITFGLKTVRMIDKISLRPMSVHLMVTDPLKYIDALKDLNCEYIFVHVEDQMYLLNILNKIKSYNIKSGLALNPITDFKNLSYLLDKVDAILFMTSEPDGEGENFNSKIIEKVKKFRNESNIEVWVDGGIKSTYKEMIVEAGVDVCVVGREIFAQEYPKEYIKEFIKTNEKEG